MQRILYIFYQLIVSLIGALLMAFSFEQFFGRSGEGYTIGFSIARFPFFQIVGSILVAIIIAPFLRVWIRNGAKSGLVGFVGLLIGYYFPYFA